MPFIGDIFKPSFQNRVLLPGNQPLTPTQEFRNKVDSLIDRRLAELNEAMRRGGSVGLDFAAYDKLSKEKTEIDDLILQGLVGPDQLPQIRKIISNFEDAGVGLQTLNEYAELQKQIQAQNKQLTDFRTKSETQLFGAPGLSLQEAITSTGGELGQLAAALRQQQADIFQQQLKPLIEQNLASRGLFESGAQVEQQAKAIGELERARQESILQAALSGREGLRSLERSDILGSQANQQSALSNMFDLQRSSITMQYQRQLEQERARLARELHGSRGGSNLLGDILSGVQIAGGIGGLFSRSLGGLGGIANGLRGLFGGRDIGGDNYGNLGQASSLYGGYTPGRIPSTYGRSTYLPTRRGLFNSGPAFTLG